MNKKLEVRISLSHLGAGVAIKGVSSFVLISLQVMPKEMFGWNFSP